MSSKLSIIILALLLALAGCDSGASPEAGSKSSPPEAATQPAAESAGPGESGAAAAPAGSETNEPAQAEPEPPAPPAQAQAQAAQDEGPAVVATVNGSPISRKFLEAQVAAMADHLFFEAPTDLSDAEQAEMDLLRRLEALSSLINLELASQEALRLGYAPSDEEVDQEWAALKKTYGQEGSLQPLLDQFGYTEDDLRGQLVRIMALKKWRENNFLAQIKVDDQEARAFYDQHLEELRHGDLVRISQIFLSVPLVGTADQKEKARAKGETVIQLLKQGLDFGTVAAEMSDDPEAADKRGDLGWLAKGQPLPVMNPDVFEMEPGQVSGLLESPLGFYIFKVTETKPAGLEPFESLRVEITDYLSAAKLEKVLDAKIAELFQKADIQILDPQLKRINEGLSKADPAGQGPETPAPGPSTP